MKRTQEWLDGWVKRLREFMAGDDLKRSDEWAIRALGQDGTAARQILKAHRERD